MWITTVTLNLNNMRTAESTGTVFDIATFQQKKAELQTLDGHGKCIPGWTDPESIDEVLDTESITVKRTWNSEQNARDFSTLASETYGEFATISVEEELV